MSTNDIPALTRGRLLAHNTIWNLLGLLLPMVVAAFAIPPLVHSLGEARFGVLSLAWVIIGYFSLFDLGLGRALTKLIADHLAQNERASIPEIVWTSLLLMLALGALGAMLMLALSGWMVHRALKIPGSIQQETYRSFQLLAFTTPMVTVTAGLRGILEALQRFRLLNLIRIPITVFSFIGPVLLLPFSNHLVPVIVVLMVGRFAGLVAHAVACFHGLPELRSGIRLSRRVIGPAVRLGGWMTVSNIVNPMLVYIDRFLIGGLLSVTAVAYYVAPFDLVTRLTVIPGALAGVLFPAFAVTLLRDQQRTQLLLERGTKYVFLCIFPVTLSVVALAPEALRLWLGPVFAANSAGVLRWLALGVFINSLAFIPFIFIQSAGRPDLTAKLHLLETPLYVAALIYLMPMFGIRGAAIVWVTRVIADAVVIWYFTQRMLPGHAGFVARLAGVIAAGGALMYLVILPQTVVARATLLLAILAGFAVAGWFRLLSPGERVFLLRGRSSAETQPEAAYK